MKRLELFVIGVLLASLAACGENPPEHPPAPPPQATPAVSPNLPEATQAAVVTNTNCPVAGEEIDPKDPKLVTFVHGGKTYGFCCKECIEDFKANPEKFTKTP